MNGTTRRDIVRLVPIAAGIALALAIGYYLQVHVGVEHYLIWGGSDCDVTYVNGERMLGCFGYPPSGIVLILGASLFVTTFLPRAVWRWWGGL